MPALAETAVDSEITSGIARPRACGQAMTSTVTVLTTASSTSPSDCPRHERDDGSGDRDVEQQGGEAVGERLGPAVAGLGVGDEALDAGQRGVVADCFDAHPHRRVGRHRAGDDAVARALGHRPGLAGDHRLVELGLAVDDRPVGRHPTAGADQHDVAEPAASAIDTERTSSPSTTSASSGSSSAKAAERATGLADRLHLLPVAEQHDRHQRRQLPPELEVEPVETRRHRRHVGDGDRHRDQQHHPGLAVTDLRDAAGEERPAAPPEHDRAEHRAEPRHPREVELVVEPVHHHLAGDDERDRQQQAEPEAAAEHLRVVAGVLVVADMRRLVLARAPSPRRRLYTPRGYRQHRVTHTPLAYPDRREERR